MCPSTCHGVGPFERAATLTRNSPTPKTLTENDAEISMMK